MNPTRSKEAGFSLLGVLVAMGAVLLVISQVFFSKAKFAKSSKKIAASESYNQMLEGFTDSLGEHLAKNLATICQGNTSSLQNIDFSGALMRYGTHINLPAEQQTQAPNLASRCASSRFNQDGKIYFCLNVTPSSSLSTDSFGGAAHGVAEVIVQAVDPLQRAINCAAFNTALPHESGLQMYYRTYWSNGKSNDLKRHSGFYYVIKR